MALLKRLGQWIDSAAQWIDTVVDNQAWRDEAERKGLCPECGQPKKAPGYGELKRKYGPHHD